MSDDLADDEGPSGWLSVSLLTDSACAEALADTLMELGALSVDIEDADAGTPQEKPQFGEPGMPTAVALWEHSRLNALFDLDQNIPTILVEAAEAVGLTAPPPYTTRHIDEQNWVRLTQAQFDPIRISSRLWIVPSWHDSPDAAAINIVLDPGMAFGTGSHPTTRLCLEWLDAQVAGGESVIDYGCGSGILALAAARLGAARVLGTDIDPNAIEAARYNAQRNQAQIELMLSTDTPHVDADIVVANILANPLCVLAPLLSRLTRPGGRIALSGILAAQTPMVQDAYRDAFDLSVGGEREGWVLLTGVRR